MSQFTLPREYFASPEIHELETERVFSNSWICAGHLSQLDPPPSYRLCQIGPYSIIVARSGEREVRAFHNVCRHRGTRICVETQGRLAQQALACPYHAWTYDLEGRLIGAPNMANVPGFDRQRYPLRGVRCEIWNGLLMVRLSESATDCAVTFEPLSRRLAAWSMDELQVAATIRYQVRANWKLLFQNYSECYHCPTVHPALNRLTPYRSAANDLVEGAILGGPMLLEEGFQTVSTDGKRVADPIAGLNEEQRRRVYYYTVFPSMFVSAHPDYVMLHLIHRLERDSTEVTCHFLAPPPSEAGEPGTSSRAEPNRAHDIRRATSFWDEVNRQDWRVCELTQLGTESPAYVPGPYSQLESMVRAFDDHYLSMMR